MSMDFNDAESNSGFDIIPVGTIAPLILTIRPGAVGEGGWETKSNSSDVTYLNVEFQVTAGPFKNRKFWQNMVVTGGKTDENGGSKAGNITRSTLRGILESARGIKPDDMSEAAKAKRIVHGYGDFSGMEFTGKIGIEKGTGGYDDKNKLLGAVAAGTPAAANSNTPAAPAAKAAAAAKGAVPSWAN